jgi:hypothetical protein
MIVPYGKSKNTSSLDKYSLFSAMEEETEVEEPVEEAPVGVAEEAPAEVDTISEDVGKVDQVEKFLNETLGGPTLDNLMVVLTAIGMSKISISVSEDKSSLSVSGAIDLADDNKIKKEK